MSGPARNKRARHSDVPYARPNGATASTGKSDSETGLLGSIWKKGLSLLTSASPTRDLLPTTNNVRQILPAEPAEASTSSGLFPRADSPPRKQIERPQVRGLSPHSTLHLPAGRSLNGGLSRSQSLRDYRSLSRLDRQSPGLSPNYHLNASDAILPADGSRVFGHSSQAPLSGRSSFFSVNDRSASPLASPLVANLSLRSPSPTAYNSPLNPGSSLYPIRSDLKRPRSAISPSYPTSPKISTAYSSTRRSPSPQSPGRRQAMTWDPKTGFIPTEEAEPKSQAEVIPVNEAERILQSLEGMKTPFSHVPSIRSIPRSATLPSIDYHSTRSGLIPLSPAGRRRRIEEHDRAESLRSQSPGIRLREKLRAQEIRRSPMRSNSRQEESDHESTIASPEPEEFPVKRQRRVEKAKSPTPPAPTRRSPRKHRKTQEDDEAMEGVAEEKPKRRPKSSKSPKKIEPVAPDPSTRRTTRSEGKKKVKEPESALRSSREAPQRSASPTRARFSARDEDMDSDDDEDATEVANKGKIALPKQVVTNGYLQRDDEKQPRAVERVDFGVQVDMDDLPSLRKEVEPKTVNAPNHINGTGNFSQTTAQQLEKIEELQSEAPKLTNAPSTTAATQPAVSKPAFSFAPPAALPNQSATSTFSFASQPSSVPADKPLDTSATKPLFSFKPSPDAAPTSSGKPTFSFKPAETPIKPPAFSFTAPTSIEKPEVPSPSNFSFTPAANLTKDTAPTASSSTLPFSFKPAEERSTTSVSTPSFSFKPILKSSEIPADAPFSFAPSKPRTGATSTPSAAFSFGTPNSDASTHKVTPGFLFSGSTPNAIPASSVSVATAEDAPSKSPFSFAMSTPNKPSEPTAMDESPPAIAASPSGPFSPVIQPSVPTVEASKPTFSFGSAVSSSATQPAFSFGQSTVPPASSPFGSAQTPTSASSIPQFTFGATTSTFGQSNTTSAAPGAGFTFGAQPPENKPAASPFTFGATPSAGAASTPSFSFGSSAPAQISSSTPSFSFGQPPSTANTGFGSVSSNAFASTPMTGSLSAGATPFQFTADNSSAVAPASPFQFGVPAQQGSVSGATTPFTFGAGSGSAPGTPTGAPGGFSFNMGSGSGVETPRSPGGRKIRRLPTRKN